MGQAQHHQAVNRLDRVNRVAACDWNPCGLADLLSTTQDFSDRFGWQHAHRHAD
jgi:hypothetical protein